MEQKRNTQAHLVARLDPKYRQWSKNETKLGNTQARQSVRENEEYSQIEQARDTLARQENRLYNKASWEETATKYYKNIKEGLTHPCNCCGRLWHINSIRKLSKQGITIKFGKEFATNTFKLPNLASEIFGEFCSTCAKYIAQGNAPRLAIVHGLVFPDIPEVLKQLTPMEERLVSPRHVFLKIVRRGQGLGFQQ